MLVTTKKNGEVCSVVSMNDKDLLNIMQNALALGARADNGEGSSVVLTLRTLDANKYEYVIEAEDDK